MGLQLIICVETNSEDNSDYIYIKSTIERFFKLDQSRVRLSPVYMDGKGNYASRKVRNKIRDLTKQYAAASCNNKSVVIYCFDTDDYDSVPEDKAFLDKARSYCDQKGYRFVWFCKDIEQVYLGRQIPNTQKKKEARKFKTGKYILQVSQRNLKQDTLQVGKSNVCDVLGDYLS